MPERNYEEHLYFYSAVILLSLVLLLQNLLWVDFVDERDNFSVGWFISRGQVLYRDIFSHHMPFPYYYSALLIKLGFEGFIGLRVGFFLTLLSFWLLLILAFGEKIGYRIISAIIFLFAAAHPLFWGNVFLADNFFGWAILVIFLYFFANPQLDFTSRDQAMIALMTFISVMSSLVSIYPIALLGLYYMLKKGQVMLRSRNACASRKPLLAEARFALLVMAPFALAMAFLWVTGSIREFFEQAYLFNTVHYSNFYSFELGGRLGALNWFSFIFYLKHLFGYATDLEWLVNPASFFWSWHSRPLFFRGFLALSNVAILFVFWRKKSPFFAVFYFLFTGLLQIRGDANIHANGYFLVSFFSVAYLMSEVYEYIRRNSGRSWKKAEILPTLYIFAYSGLAILFLAMVLLVHFSNGSGNMLNEAEPSPYPSIVRAITAPDEPIWVMPIDPVVYLSSERMSASKYTFYLPWLAESDEINEAILRDLQLKKPPVIIFNERESIWGKYPVTEYGKPVVGYIKANYYQVDADDPIFTRVWLINEKKNLLLKKLYLAGMYYPVDAK